MTTANFKIDFDYNGQTYTLSLDYTPGVESLSYYDPATEAEAEILEAENQETGAPADEDLLEELQDALYEDDGIWEDLEAKFDEGNNDPY